GDVAGRANRLRIGAAFSRGATNAANYVNVLGTRGTLLSSAHTVATNFDAFAENQLTLDHGFTLVAGATTSNQHRVNQRIFAGNDSYRRDYTNFSPKIGLRWDSSKQLQVYANFSGSFELPSFSEVGAIA